MRVRAIDQNGDYVCTGATSEFLVDSPAAVAQCIQTALALWQGQWWLDVSAGVPWSTEVLGRYPTPLYDQVIKTAILDVTGVNSILSYSSSLSNRNLTVNVACDTIYGLVQTTAIIQGSTAGGYGVGGLGDNPLGS
jgi:hypothetical protein